MDASYASLEARFGSLQIYDFKIRPVMFQSMMTEQPMGINRKCVNRATSKDVSRSVATGGGGGSGGYRLRAKL